MIDYIAWPKFDLRLMERAALQSTINGFSKKRYKSCKKLYLITLPKLYHFQTLFP